MKKKQRNLQIILISTGILLILITYFYYPYMKKVKFAKEQSVEKNLPEASDQDKDSAFENVEYRGLYDLDKTFTVKSQKAHILNEEPDVVYMTDMHVILYLKDGRTVDIVSDQGKYNKATYDCFFEKNVKATDGETKIFAENLDLLATESIVKVYNNVVMNNPEGSLNADKIDYDLETKYFKVSMFGDAVVKMKVMK